MQARLDGLIRGGEARTREILGYVEDQGQRLRDYVWPLGPAGMGFYTAGEERALAVTNRRGNPAQGEPSQVIATLHPHATEQAAGRLDLPGGFMKRLADGAQWQRQLAATIFDEHATNAQQERRLLIRVVGTRAMAVLSNRYRRLNSLPVLEAFTAALDEAGAVPYDGTWEDTRFSIQALLPQMFELQLGEHGWEYLAFGIRLRTSDFGDGALALSAFTARLVCTNLHIGRSVMREVHLGGRLPDDIIFSDRTYELDTRTTASAVRDATRQVTSVEAVRGHVAQLELAAGQAVDPERELAALMRSGSIGQGERDLAMGALGRSDTGEVPAGPATRYKLANALSWVANQKESVRARTDLQELAGDYLGGRGGR